MKTSAQGVAAIAAWEGCILTAYRDSGGAWTIGVGHTAAAGGLKPAAGMKITRDQAYSILADDLAKCEARVAKYLGAVPQNVFDAAVSFDFNTGAIDTATWVDAYKRGDMADARRRLMLWVKVAGKTVQGLVNRRNAEAAMLFENKYPNAPAVDQPAPAPINPVVPAAPVIVGVGAGAAGTAAIQAGVPVPVVFACIVGAIVLTLVVQSLIQKFKG